MASAPRIFTKLTKVLFAELCKAGHLNTSYIEDSFLIASSEQECQRNVIDIVEISKRAGFVVHRTKSVLQPTQCIAYLGFWLDSVNMTVKMKQEKIEKLKVACQVLLETETVSIQLLAQAIGRMVASFPGVQYGQLFYRRCDNLKNEALKVHKGNYAAKITEMVD